MNGHELAEGNVKAKDKESSRFITANPLCETSQDDDYTQFKILANVR